MFNSFLSLPQIGHWKSETTPLRSKFVFIGKRLLQALHKNILTVFGILKFHITFFQTESPSRGLDPHHVALTVTYFSI
jgi:hypothetical protein